MTEYRHTNQKPAPLLFTDLVQEKKAARRKLLEQVAQRRKPNNKRFMEKKQHPCKTDIIILRYLIYGKRLQRYQSTKNNNVFYRAICRILPLLPPSPSYFQFTFVMEKFRALS
jgi:hypothetical protein